MSEKHSMLPSNITHSLSITRLCVTCQFYVYISHTNVNKNVRPVSSDQCDFFSIAIPHVEYIAKNSSTAKRRIVVHEFKKSRFNIFDIVSNEMKLY